MSAASAKLSFRPSTSLAPAASSSTASASPRTTASRSPHTTCPPGTTPTSPRPSPCSAANPRRPDGTQAAGPAHARPRGGHDRKARWVSLTVQAHRLKEYGDGKGAQEVPRGFTEGAVRLLRETGKPVAQVARSTIEVRLRVTPRQPRRYPPRPGPAERRPLAVAAITTLEVFSSRRHQRREQKAPISIIRVRHHRPCRSAESGARSAGVCASPRRGPITRCERKHRVDEFAIACHPPMAAQNGPRSGVAAIINCAGAGSSGGRRVRAWLLPAVGRLL